MKICLFLSALLYPVSLFAQRPVPIRPQRTPTETVVSQMFRLDPRAANHSLSAHLPGDALLTIESQGVSYWPSQTELARIAELAAAAVKGVQDSFRSATSEKCVAIHLPIGENPQTVQYTENGSSANLVVRSGSAQAALKAGFDTVRILKTYGIKTSKKDSARPQQIQYTFILKSLADFESISANTPLLDDVARTMDSVVARKKRQWGRDDAWYHGVEAVYRPERSANDDERLMVQRSFDAAGNRGISKGIEGALGIEVTLLRNTLMPGLYAGFGYRWPKARRSDEWRFVRLSNNTVFQTRSYPVGSGEGYIVDASSMVNLELGTVFNRANTMLPLYRTSVGVGYVYQASGLSPFISSQAPLDAGSVRVFLTYSASKLITIIPQIYFGPNDAPYTIGVRVGL